MSPTKPPGSGHPLVEHWDDERALGNGIIVTLRPGYVFYDDCGVMGFDTVAEARDAIEAVAGKPRKALEPHGRLKSPKGRAPWRRLR